MKKILVMMMVLIGIGTFSTERPKFEVGASVGYTSRGKQKNGVAPSISFEAKWNTKVSEKYTVFYGLGSTLALEYLIDGGKDTANNELDINLFVNGLVEGQYEIQDNLHWYIKGQLGLGPNLSLKANGSKVESKGHVVVLSTVSTGIKYKEYKAGIFGGYGKGFIGLELGYEF